MLGLGKVDVILLADGESYQDLKQLLVQRGSDAGRLPLFDAGHRNTTDEGDSQIEAQLQNILHPVKVVLTHSDPDAYVDSIFEQHGDLRHRVIEGALAAKQVMSLTVRPIEADPDSRTPVLLQPLDARQIQKSTVG